MSEREGKIKIKHTLRTLTTKYTRSPLRFLALNKHQVGAAPVQGKLGRRVDNVWGFIYQKTHTHTPAPAPARK